MTRLTGAELELCQSEQGFGQSPASGSQHELLVPDQHRTRPPPGTERNRGGLENRTYYIIVRSLTDLCFPVTAGAVM